MADLKKVMLIGNIGSIETKSLESGQLVSRISIATNKKVKNKDTGEESNFTEWHSVVAWRKLAEIVKDYAKKGQKVYVEGELQTRSYEKDGETKYTTDINANTFNILSPKSEN